MLKWPQKPIVNERPMIPFILAGQLIAISAASCSCGGSCRGSQNATVAAALFSMALFSIGIASARRAEALRAEASALRAEASALRAEGLRAEALRAAASIFAITMGAAALAAIASSWASQQITVVACCIVTAAACITREPAGTSVAGMLFVVIVLNADDVVWDWNVVYALAAAFVTSTVFSRVYAHCLNPQDTSDVQVVANAWHCVFVH